MEILRSIAELERLPGPLFAAIGVFDGIHLGHQAVISTSAQHAREAGGTAVVITFDPHPAKVLRPEEAPHLLTATQHKIALIRDLGVAHLLILRFDREFAATPPEEFVLNLVRIPNRCAKFVSATSGRLERAAPGNLALLKELGRTSTTLM